MYCFPKRPKIWDHRRQIMQNNPFKKFFLAGLCLLIFFYPATAISGTDAIKIGVLAKRSTDNCLKKWSPTADYLSRVIPDYSFRIIPLEFKDINQTVKDGGGILFWQIQRFMLS